MRIAQPIELSENELKTLTSWSRGRRIPTRLMKRAKIVLMASEGQENQRIAELLGLIGAKSRAGADGLSTSDWRRSKRMLLVEGERQTNETASPL